MSEQESLTRLDLPAARRWAAASRSALAAHRAELDELNIFPVPDGDTGTNLYLTLDSALDDLRERSTRSDAAGGAPDAGLAEQLADLAGATLLSARGNSGVIFSQLVRGLSQTTTARQAEPDGGPPGLDGADLARALSHASELARASVRRPVEGTMLSVADAAARAARQSADGGGGLLRVAHAAHHAAQEALRRTPEQLPVLRAAGVVDAGGAGLVLVLRALERVVAGEPVEVMPQPAPPRGPVRDGSASHAYRRPDGPAYEVMYLLDAATPAAVDVLREQLDALGESLLVVGGPDGWNVHVHTDQVGAAIEAGIAAGRPHRLAVTRFADVWPQPAQSDGASEPTEAIGVLACASGAGLAALYERSGAAVLRTGPGSRASVPRMLAAARATARATGAPTVLILPDDTATRLVAQAAAVAASEQGLLVHVVRSTASVQVIAALAVFDPSARPAENLMAMSAAAAATLQGGVTVATREGLTSVGRCHPGDVLGMVDDDIAVVGADLLTVALAVVDLLLGSGGEMLTLVYGAEVDPRLPGELETAVHRQRPHVEVSLLAGEQPGYPLLIGVE